MLTITEADVWETKQSTSKGVLVKTSQGEGTTVSVQWKRQEQDESSWEDIPEGVFTTGAARIINCGAGWDVRIGVKPDEYQSPVTVDIHAL